MKINLNELKNNKLHKVDYNFFIKIEDVELTEGKLLEDLKVHIELEKKEYYYLAIGTLSTSLACACSTCLEEVITPIQIDINFVAYDGTNLEDYEKDEETIYFGAEEIDIDPYIKEQFYFNLPLHFKCKEDCKGLCHNCGLNLNEQSCSCMGKNTDPRWDKLKKLL